MLRALLFIIGMAIMFTAGYLVGRRITKKYTLPVLKFELGLFYDSIIEKVQDAKERKIISKLYNDALPRLEKYRRNDFL